jgi:transposase
MGYSRKQFQAVGFDEAEWQNYYHRRQQSYLRVKLLSIKRYWEGHRVLAIAQELGLSSKSIRQYLRQYLHSGLAGLSQPTQRPQPSALTQAQAAAFKTTLLTSCPQDHGLEGRIWTGHQMKQYLNNTYQVAYKSGIYDLLERLNLSHQKAHRSGGPC